MKKSPYETFACTGYGLDKIIQPIQLEFVTNPSASMQDLENMLGNSTFLLFSNDTFNPAAFAHPVDIVNSNARENHETGRVVVDTRPFTKMSRNGLFDVTKFADYDLARRRGILHAIWRTSDQYMLQNAISPLMPMFAAWVSETLAKHLSIDNLTQLKIANIAAWWFWCQCHDESDLTDEFRPKIYREIGEATRASFETIESDLNDIPYFDGVEVFCDEVKERTASTRVKHLDPASVLQLCAGGWIGVWSREIMTVAIEYPPYFAAVVYTAIHERGMRAALFSKFVTRYVMRPEVKGFKNTIERLSGDNSQNN